MELDHTADAGQLMQKLVELTNEKARLVDELIEAGSVLNHANGLFHEKKARIRSVTEKINTVKIVLKAEANNMGGM